MNALRKFSRVALAALLAAALLSSCAHGNTKPTGNADGKATEGVGDAPAATFSVTAIGTTPLSYHWQFNGTKVPGATNGPAVTNK